MGFGLAELRAGGFDAGALKASSFSIMQLTQAGYQATELKVAGLPTLLFMRDGAEVHRLEGVPGNAAALEQLAAQHLGVPL